MAQKKATARGVSRQWDEASFFAALRRDPGDWAVPIGRALFDWAGERGLEVWYGKGPKQATMGVGFIERPDERHPVFKCHAPGGVMLQFDHLKLLPPFDDLMARDDLRVRLGTIQGVVAEELADTWPSVRWDLLRPEGSLRSFLSVYDWVVERIRNAQA